MRGFTGKDGRSVALGQKVAVYRNLHRACWSVECASSGLVLGYCDEITLRGLEKAKRKGARTTFHVVESVRKKVVEKKKKDVHAYVIGYLESFDYEQLESIVYYNPYKVATFVSDGCAVYHADLISLNIATGTVTASNARGTF